MRFTESYTSIAQVMTPDERKEWDDMIIDFGRAQGVSVNLFDKHIHLHASKDGCSARVPKKTFDRLRREGRIDRNGTVLEYGVICL